MRDLKANPYSPDEVKVAKFIAEAGIGGGDDPIKFILASYSYIMEKYHNLGRALAEIAAPIPNIGDTADLVRRIDIARNALENDH